MTRINIEGIEHIEFDWSDGKRVASLAALYAHILKKVKGSIDWYQTKRVPKRTQALCFRVGAIVLGAMAAALPTVSEMTRTTDGWLLRPGVATVLGVVVGVLLMLDKFIGASSAWVRYIMAETALKELNDELHVAYALEAAQWAGQAEPSVEQTRHAVATLQGFLLRANQIVRDETNQWKDEFQSALRQVEELGKAPPKEMQPALCTVKIANPARLVGKWSLSINGGAAEEVSGDSRSFARPPGAITVRVEARLKTNDPNKPDDFVTERAEVLIPDTPKTIEIPLP